MSSPSLPPSANHELSPGTLVAERYRVVSTLGQGGMGIVYLAEHVHMRKRLALKVLLPQWTSTPEVVARFEREAVAAGAIAHPNVAAALDFGRLPDGSFFLVLEYLEGRTLRAEIERGPIAPARALDIARGIASGVSAAHAKGIVHRDLKPENVMLVARHGDPDVVKVLDFGIARVEAGRTPSGVALTSAGAILGTPDYMAPEQAVGADIDGRADLYSLGVILFEMLTGACPFRGGTMTLLRQQMLTPAPPLPEAVVAALPESARGVVARLLEKEPAARFATAHDLLATLDAPLAPPRPITFSGAALPHAATVHAGSAPLSAHLPARARALVQRALRGPRHKPILLALAAFGALALLRILFAATGSSSSAPSASATAVEIEIPPPPHPHAGARAHATPPVAANAANAAPSSPETPPTPADSVPPPPAPSATTTASASSQPSSSKHTARRTGPGGIYIPPPNTWFK